MSSETWLLVGASIAALWLAGTLALERRARVRGRPGPRPFTLAWATPVAIMLLGVLVIVAANLLGPSFEALAVGIAIAFIGALLRLYDKVSRAFFNR